ncbi:hypothetical protein RIF29_40832 [Crotalaria pallida]|uniref:Uncharacterized protein n=1 Tax=Crotalaria pallida TaxID=3830 RepID=A0AAN9E4K3_CROPI
MDEKMCALLFGGRVDIDWEFVPSSGRSGGVVSIWKKSVFEKMQVCSGPGFIAIKGVLKAGSVACCVVNVYSPCSLSDRRSQWQELILVKNQLGNSVCEEMNQIDIQSEMVDLNSQQLSEDLEQFHPFQSVSSDVEDYPWEIAYEGGSSAPECHPSKRVRVVWVLP